MAPMDTDSPGRSGARFMNSFDKMYVVKTILSEEVAEMHRILKEYHQVYSPHTQGYHQVCCILKKYHQVCCQLKKYHQV